MSESNIDLRLSNLKSKILAVLDWEGVYPISVTQGDVTKHRTEWQEGWNACFIALTHNICLVLDSELDLPIVSKLSVSSRFSIAKDKYLLNMNDTFYYASADAEEIKENEIPEVYRLFDNYGDAGLIYFVAKKRDEKPKIPRNRKIVEAIFELENNDID